MKFKHRLQRLEAQRPKKRDLTGVPVEDMTDEEIDGEIYRITGKWPPPMSEMTDEEIEQELAKLKAAEQHEL